MKDITSVYGHVTGLERPLEAIRNFGNGILLISETLEEPGASAVNELTRALLEQLQQIDDEYSTLFRLTHPNREHFVRERREGWTSAN
jgi:hypothetical protein